MTNLAELLERVKAATGPDRELNEALSWHFGKRGLGHQPFTSSLDSALALVERVLPGWDCSAVRIAGAAAEGYVWPHHDSLRQHQGHGSTPALALLAALLSALIAQPASDDVGNSKLTRDA